MGMMGRKLKSYYGIPSQNWDEKGDGKLLVLSEGEVSALSVGKCEPRKPPHSISNKKDFMEMQKKKKKYDSKMNENTKQQKSSTVFFFLNFYEIVHM